MSAAELFAEIEAAASAAYDAVPDYLRRPKLREPRGAFELRFVAP